MNDNLIDNIKQQSTWLRGLYMLMYSLFYGVVEFVLFFIVIFQFFMVLLTGDNNPRLQKLGQSIATYAYQIIQYLTFNSNYHAYPFGAWPKGEPVSLKKQSLESEDSISS